MVVFPQFLRSEVEIPSRAPVVIPREALARKIKSLPFPHWSEMGEGASASNLGISVQKKQLISDSEGHAKYFYVVEISIIANTQLKGNVIKN